MPEFKPGFWASYYECLKFTTLISMGEDHFIEGHHIIATNGYLHPLFQELSAEVPPLEM